MLGRFDVAAIGSLMAILTAAVVMLLAGMRLSRSGMRPGPGDALLIAIGVSFLFLARAKTKEIDRAAMSMVLQAAPEVFPIVEVAGVLAEIESATPISNRGTGNEWSSRRGILEVTSAPVPSWIGARMTVRFDRPGGQEVVGAELRMLGRLHPHEPASNPGVHHRTHGGRRVAGTLVVTHPGLITVVRSSGSAITHVIREARQVWRSSIGRLDTRMSEVDESVTSGLFTALLTGDRSGLDIDFRMAAVRSGLAHLLAISGLHLAVIAVIVAGCMKVALGRSSRLTLAVPVLAVSLFGILVIPGPSVQRAVLMVVVFGGLLMLGRRVRATPLVLLVLAAMCWRDPDWPQSIGFQLTAVATLALACSMAPSRERWFGPPDRVGRSRGSMAMNRMGMASTAGIVAWSTTLPIVLANFGVASLLSVPSTILGSPLLAPILGLGIVCGVFEAWFPDAFTESFARAIVVPTGMFGRFVSESASILSPVSTTTSVAGRVLSVPMAIAVGVLLGIRSRRTRWLGLSVVVLTAMFCFGIRNTSVTPRVRMIDVGNGSAIVVRSDRQVLLYDAGSNSRSESGSRVVIPTLRRIGVRSIDAIVISHPNSDHFNAVEEIIEVMPVGRVITTDLFMQEARSGRRPELIDLLEALHGRGVPIETVARGDRLGVGLLEVRVIHPDREDDHRTVNDSSLVMAVGVRDVDSDAEVDLLLTGDIQNEGIARVLAREKGLNVSIMEIPHHGSWRPIAAEMIRIFDPDVVIQSTGPRRWRHDRFGEACAGRRRLVTSRDGSFVVDLPVD